VLVTVCWTCRRPDGSTIWEFRDSYLLASEQGRWWIVGDVVHEEPEEEPRDDRRHRPGRALPMEVELDLGEAAAEG
jgi:hypothetical protein